MFLSKIYSKNNYFFSLKLLKWFFLLKLQVQRGCNWFHYCETTEAISTKFGNDRFWVLWLLYFDIFSSGTEKQVVAYDYADKANQILCVFNERLITIPLAVPEMVCGLLYSKSTTKQVCIVYNVNYFNSYPKISV
jgi:hypothetical protein